MKQTDSEATERALHLFRVLARCSRSVIKHAEQDIKQQEMTPSEFAVLELLYHKGPTPLSEIARGVLLTTGSMTHVIDQLERRGLVRRLACDNDRRIAYADLTETGREKITAIFPAHAEQIRQAVSGLDAREQEQAIELLKKLGLAAEQMQAPHHEMQDSTRKKHKGDNPRWNQ